MGKVERGGKNGLEAEGHLWKGEGEQKEDFTGNKLQFRHTIPSIDPSVGSGLLGLQLHHGAGNLAVFPQVMNTEG